MTALIAALDGLDYGYVDERDLLSTLDPQLLVQDLEGENALYTHRVWPAIWAGENGGQSAEEYDEWDPDLRYIWDKYSTKVLLGIDQPAEPVLINQNQFPTGYRRAAGPQTRLGEMYQKFRRGIHSAIEGYEQLVVVGCKVPDLLGHHDQNEDRIHENIEKVCQLVERQICRDEITDYLVVSDHGFDYDRFGEEPSGLAAHTRDAVFASSFCDYDSMSAFIENWHGDLDGLMREKHLRQMGYK